LSWNNPSKIPLSSEHPKVLCGPVSTRSANAFLDAGIDLFNSTTEVAPRYSACECLLEALQTQRN
jgi:hypothetical protein